MELVVFIIAGAISIIGAIGLIRSSNPVHAALNLIMTLFAVAVLFLNQDAQFLAAVQIIVYAGAIVVLFLFVIMLLGVDQAEDLSTEPIVGQRPIAAILALAVLGLALIPLISTGGATGVESATAPKVDSITGWSDATETLPDNQTSGVESQANIAQLGRVIFTDYVYAFEITALLLTIAVVGAVVLARRHTAELQPIPEPESLYPVASDAATDIEASDAGEGESA